MASAYEFSFSTIQGKPYPLKDLAGKPFVVVNTASKCGFTPQYKALEALWKANQGAGLVVIGVPSNDFGGQEPGNNDEIASFCELNYGVDFPMMAKERVTGKDAHPFFKWVAAEAGFLARPRWNFYKYLVDKQGGLEAWFGSITSPDSKKFTGKVKEVL